MYSSLKGQLMNLGSHDYIHCVVVDARSEVPAKRHTTEQVPPLNV